MRVAVFLYSHLPRAGHQIEKQRVCGSNELEFAFAPRSFPLCLHREEAAPLRRFLFHLDDFAYYRGLTGEKMRVV